MNALFQRSFRLGTVLLPLLSACSESPVQPVPDEPTITRQFHFDAPSLPIVQRSFAVEADDTEEEIGPRGGVLYTQGVMLIVPPGALTEEVEITLHVPAGRNLSARLLPHGLAFRRPVYLAFGLEGTEYNPETALKELVGAYHVDPLTAPIVRPNEVMSLRILNGMAAFGIWHFCNYSITLGKGLILLGG
ncbi:MAG: hypothetical protein ACT443_10860 [Gemmatimonadota bacterium]